MRELTRFRKEFNECHSLRSKLILTKTICKDVDGLIDLNQEIIDEDQKYLTGFQNKKNNLFFRRQGTVTMIKSGQENVQKRFVKV